MKDNIDIKAKRSKHGRLIIRDSKGEEFTVTEDAHTGLLRIQAKNGSVWVKPVCANVVELGVTDFQGISRELHMSRAIKHQQ